MALAVRSMRFVSFPTRLVGLLLGCGFWGLIASPVFAQLPNVLLGALSPAGGKQGTTFDLSISSFADLDGVDRLVFSHPGITAVPKMSAPTPFQKTPQPILGQFTVTIAADVPVGMYDARCAGRFGVSNPRAFMVGDLTEAMEQPGNVSPDKAMPITLESVVNGVADASSHDWYKFSAKAGQRVLIDCWAARLDSRMYGKLRLRDSAGRELANDRDTNARDPFLDFMVPADGEYFLAVYDFVYAGGPEYFYRLAIGTFPRIDFVYPPVVAPGASAEVSVFGRNLPGGAPAAGVTVKGRPLDRLTIKIDAPAAGVADRRAVGGQIRSADSFVDRFEYRIASPQGVSNAATLTWGSAPVVLEVEPNDLPEQSQSVAVPCEYVGQFGVHGDLDRVTFEAKAGDTYWVEVYSQRLGLPTDPRLLIQSVKKDEQGKEQVADVVELDDDGVNSGGFAYNTISGDPNARFQAPADGTYRILLYEQESGELPDPRNVYRLSIRKAQPDFRLAVLAPYPLLNRAEARPWNPQLRRGGAEPLDIVVSRKDGYTGPISVSCEGLPAGVTCPAILIGADQSSGTLVLQAADDAAPFVGPILVLGKATIDGAEVSREATPGLVLFPAAANIVAQARSAREIVLAVNASDVEPFRVDAGEGKSWDMSRGGKLQIPLKLTRRGEIKAAVTFTAFGLPPNVQPQALAFDANTNEGKFELVLPTNAPLGKFTLYLQAQSTVGYRRDPQAAEAAVVAQTEITKIVADATTASQAADAAKVAADTAAATAATALQAATDAKTAAETAGAKAAEEAKTAADAAAAAKAAADKDSQNQDLATASQNAAKASEEAATRAKTASDALAVAVKTLEDATAAMKKTAEDKAAAEKVAVDAAAALKAATDYKAVVDKKVADTAAASAAKDVAVVFPVATVPFEIVAMPTVPTITPPPAALKQGDKGEITVSVNRLYAFADPINLEVVTPGGVAGVAITNMQIPAGQNEIKLPVTIAADATPGTHTFTLRINLTLNGQGLTSEHPFQLTVEKTNP